MKKAMPGVRLMGALSTPGREGGGGEEGEANECVEHAWRGEGGLNGAIML